MRTSVSIQYRHEQRRHRLDARVDGPGAADDAGARLLLRRHGPLEERAEHDDDELRRARPGGGGLGAAGLFAGLRAGRAVPRIAGLCRAARRRPRGPGRDSAPAVHGLPGHLRHHHRGADLGGDRRAAAVRHLPGVHRRLDAGRLRAGGALGVGRRLPRLCRGARLRRRRGRARERGGGGAGGGAGGRSAQGLRAPRDPAAQRALHAARRRAAVVRLVRLQRRQRPGGVAGGGARLRQHAAGAGGDPGHLGAPRSASRAAG